jgi:hypothetical protein
VLPLSPLGLLLLLLLLLLLTVVTSHRPPVSSLALLTIFWRAAVNWSRGAAWYSPTCIPAEYFKVVCAIPIYNTGILFLLKHCVSMHELGVLRKV